MSSSLTILMTCCAGFSAWETSAPRARSLIALMNTRTTGRATSASSSAMRISRAVASMSASVSRPLPRRPVKTLSRRSERVSNTARPQKSRARARRATWLLGYGPVQGTASLQGPTASSPGVGSGVLLRVVGRRGPPSGGVPQAHDVGHQGQLSQDDGRAALGARPLGALATVVGVPVDARRLHELGDLPARGAGPHPAVHGAPLARGTVPSRPADGDTRY